jgi:hypothetical protein
LYFIRDGDASATFITFRRFRLRKEKFLTTNAIPENADNSLTSFFLCPMYPPLKTAGGEARHGAADQHALMEGKKHEV